MVSDGLNYIRMASHLWIAPGIALCTFALYTAADALVGFFHTKEALARLNE